MKLNIKLWILTLCQHAQLSYQNKYQVIKGWMTTDLGTFNKLANNLY